MAAQLIPLKIANGSYASVKDHPVFATPDLKARLENAKYKDGTVVWDALVARGFSGGKHLIETVRNKYGANFKVVLSDDASNITDTDADEMEEHLRGLGTSSCPVGVDR